MTKQNGDFCCMQGNNVEEVKFGKAGDHKNQVG